MEKHWFQNIRKMTRLQDLKMKTMVKIGLFDLALETFSMYEAMTKCYSRKKIKDTSRCGKKEKIMKIISVLFPRLDYEAAKH